MKVGHKTLIFLAGLVWLVIGIFLMSLGIHFLFKTIQNPSLLYQPHKLSLAAILNRWVADPAHCVVVLITCALFLGYFKGKMALAKSVNRQLKRLASLPQPAPLYLIYSKGYYLLIGGMIGLGMLLRFVPITLDTRGVIDIAIGSALINGSLLYFRHLVRLVTERGA